MTAPPIPMGVTPGAWTAIGAKSDGRSWIIPERNGLGEIVGASIRAPDGGKSFKPGGHRGLTLAWPLPSYAGSSADCPIYVVEGASDTAAGLVLGLVTVGRPSASARPDELKLLLQGRHVCIIADNDPAGQSGASSLGAALTGHTESVRIISPPKGVKDLREWVLAGGTAEVITAAMRAAPPLTHAANSIRASKGRVLARIELTPVPVTELGPAKPPEWVWPGYIARGHATLFTGLWKAGKSTLIGSLLHDLGVGGGLAPCALGMRVLVISEESATHWCRRRDDLNLGSCIHVICRPLKAKPDSATWHELVDQVITLVRVLGYGLVVFDTLPSFWSVKDENDASEVGAALMPFNELMNAGTALLLVHHPRKGGGDQGQASRGSGALPGFVDVIVEMERYAFQDMHDRRRVLKTYSRFEESPPESVVELTDQGYRVIGGSADVSKANRAEILASILRSHPNGLTADEVCAAWPATLKPGIRTISTDLALGVEDGRFTKRGRGRRANPFRFAISSTLDSCTPNVLDAGIESNAHPTTSLPGPKSGGVR